jgi:hypothetical protein
MEGVLLRCRVAVNGIEQFLIDATTSTEPVTRVLKVACAKAAPATVVPRYVWRAARYWTSRAATDLSNGPGALRRSFAMCPGELGILACSPSSARCRA